MVVFCHGHGCGSPARAALFPRGGRLAFVLKDLSTADIVALSAAGSKELRSSITGTEMRVLWATRRMVFDPRPGKTTDEVIHHFMRGWASVVRHIVLAGCSGVTDAGVRELVPANPDDRHLVSIDLNGCKRVTGVEGPVGTVF
jgi:hypothetical protein